MSDKQAKASYQRGAKYARLAPLDHVKNLYEGANSVIVDGEKPRRIFHKRHLVEAVRHVSPVKAVLAAQARPKAERGITTAGPASDQLDSTTRALMDLEAGVNNNARRYNDLKELADRKEARLLRLQDQLHELEIENQSLTKIADTKTAEADRIKELQAQIAAVKERMDNKLVQQAQYDHMMRRLKTNQVAFDAHITGMDNALKASKKEYDEVHTLMRQLENSRQEALQALNKYQTQLAAQRAVRAKELQERRTEAANARRMEEWRKQREAKRAEMAAELRGDLTADQEQELLQELQAKEGESEQLKAASQERARKAMTLEQAFKQIKQATGVHNLKEMVQKFMSQGENKKALEDEKAEAELRLAKIKLQKEEAENQFAALKASDIGGTELSRERIAMYDKEIAAARAQLKVSTSACERLEGVLVAVRQGAVGLAQRLEPFDFLDDGPVRDDDYSSDSQASDSQMGQDTLNNLQKAERKLVKMLEAMSSASVAQGPRATEDDPRRARSAAGTRTDPAVEPARTWTPHDNSDPMVHGYNVRVRSRMRQAMDARSDDDAGSEEDDEEGSGAEVREIHDARSRIKRMGEIMVKSQQRRVRKGKRGSEEGGSKGSSKGSGKKSRASKAEKPSRLTSSHSSSLPIGLASLVTKPPLL